MGGPGGSASPPALAPALTQDVTLAERAGLPQEQPRVHAVPVKLVGARQHPQPLRGGTRGGRRERNRAAVP